MTMLLFLELSQKIAQHLPINTNFENNKYIRGENF
jgi:hypothetical protein